MNKKGQKHSTIRNSSFDLFNSDDMFIDSAMHFKLRNLVRYICNEDTLIGIDSLPHLISLIALSTQDVL